MAVLRAETFTGDHQHWGQPCTPGAQQGAGDPLPCTSSRAWFQPQQLPHLVVPLVAMIPPVPGWAWEGRTGTLAPAPPAPPKPSAPASA